MQVDKAQVVEILRSRSEQQLADRVNANCPAMFDPAEVEMLRHIELGIDSADAARHANDGRTEDMSGLPNTS